jgi:hypothetical protein
VGRVTLSIVGAAAWVSAGCPSFGTFECRTSEECNRPGSARGECLPDGACAYEDDLCPSGKRRSPYAPLQPGACVEEPDPSSSGDAETTAGADSEATTATEATTAASTGAIDCQLGFAFRRELEIVADAALPAGHSLAVEIDHAALVQAGKAAGDGSDVRVFEVDDGCPGLELDRVADPRIGWNASTTRIWFAAPDPVAAGETRRGLFLYYGHEDPDPPPANWNAVFEVGSDFDGDALPEGLQASTNPPGALVVSGGTLRLYHELVDISAAAIVALAEPLPADNRFEFVNRARLVSGRATNSNMKYFAMVASAEAPEVSEQAPEHERRILAAHHLTNNQQGIDYKTNDGGSLSWDGDAWGPAAFWGGTGLGSYTTHAFVSSADAFFIVASDGETVLTTTDPVPWSMVRVPSGPRWLYMGEVFVDYYVCVAEYDWFFLRRTVDPEPAVQLGGEDAL